MKRCWSWMAGWSFVFLLVPALGADDRSGEGMARVNPVDNRRALVNPSMGWTFHYYSNIPENYGSRLEASDLLADFPGLSTIYLRLPWAYLEPEEGVYSWSVVDAPAQRWIDQGLRVAFRFTCSESWMRYGTPQWVEKAGAKGFNFTFGIGATPEGVFWEPDYNDPVFLEKHEAFLRAAAQRYDGSPHVDFIDVGSFGVWGEGHTFASTQIKYSSSTIMRHVDLYQRCFKKTLLAANDDFDFQGREGIDYALAAGMTLRDDSILVQPPPNQYFHADLAQSVWPKYPVILENEHYGSSRDRGAWGDGSWLMRAIEEYHASYGSIHWWPREFLEQQRDLIDRINLRLGYRLQLRQAEWPEKISLSEPLPIRTRWANAGVAPCYPGAFPTITLKDEKEGIVAVFANPSFNARSLEVGPPEAAPEAQADWQGHWAINMKPGVYQLFISMGELDGTPVVALPLDGGDGHRRYRLGSVQVVEKPE